MYVNNGNPPLIEGAGASTEVDVVSINCAVPFVR
jgi:hypothetical protein